MDIGYTRPEVPCKKFVTKIVGSTFAPFLCRIVFVKLAQTLTKAAKSHAVLPPGGLPRIGLQLIIGYVQNSNDNGLPGF